jgi:uncharacterized membrane protein
MTNELLIPLVAVAITLACMVAGLLIGYWMGRNSAERPFVSEAAAVKVASQGPTDEPESDDIFKEALHDNRDIRFSTTGR